MEIYYWRIGEFFGVSGDQMTYTRVDWWWLKETDTHYTYGGRQLFDGVLNYMLILGANWLFNLIFIDFDVINAF